MKIAVIGLGYVGLPLARLFATKNPVIGYDINKERVALINEGIDITKEISTSKLKAVLSQEINMEKGLYCTSKVKDIKDCNCYIITVPTPIDKNQIPNLTPLLKASKKIGSVLKKGDIVIYESTVYPGVTEDECVPVLELASNLKFNKDFFVGYSPERINPGDKERTVDKILKITSGSTPEIAIIIDDLYRSVISAGTHLAPSIKVAESAKVIENSQRDINIAFMNELAKIFHVLDIDTYAVLEAAKTKWNFLDFKPGLVGGHCISIDPYYIARKAMDHGLFPEIILAGRRINDKMGEYIAKRIIDLMIKKNIVIGGSNILLLGITFKENCPDIRNTKLIDVIVKLSNYGANVTVVDPWASAEEVKNEYDINLKAEIPDQKYDGVILGVAHNDFLSIDVTKVLNEPNFIFDIKGIMEKSLVDSTL